MTVWERHHYVDDDGRFPATLATFWERQVLHELTDSAVEGWLRNLERKLWSLTIPYEFLGESHPLYPGFHVLRRDGSSLKVDLLDSHRMSLEDAPSKAAGLATYGARHGASFGRIELIIVENDLIKRLSLKDKRVPEQVTTVTTYQQLGDLFALT